MINTAIQNEPKELIATYKEVPRRPAALRAETYDFSTIILSCNDREYLRKCLTAYKAAENPPVSEVIVVDNGSTDGTLGMLIEEFPYVKIIRNEINRGVAYARNQGIRHAAGKHLLFLDSDTEVRRGALGALFEAIDSHSDVAVAGPELVYPDGSPQYSGRTFPTPLTFLLRGFKVGKNSGAIRKHLMKDVDRMQERAVDFVIGACMAIRRDALDDVGAFDDKYFFGYEDPDFAYRAAKKGWKTVHVPDAVITHHYRRRSAHGFIFNRLKWEHGLSALRFFRKRYLQK